MPKARHGHDLFCPALSTAIPCGRNTAAVCVAKTRQPAGATETWMAATKRIMVGGSDRVLATHNAPHRQTQTHTHTPQTPSPLPTRPNTHHHMEHRHPIRTLSSPPSPPPNTKCTHTGTQPIHPTKSLNTTIPEQHHTNAPFRHLKTDAFCLREAKNRQTTTFSPDFRT